MPLSPHWETSWADHHTDVGRSVGAHEDNPCLFETLILKCNSKVANVSPCLAMKEQGSWETENRKSEPVIRQTAVDANFKGRLSNIGLSDLDTDSYHASPQSKRKFFLRLLKSTRTFSPDILAWLWLSARVYTPHLPDWWLPLVNVIQESTTCSLPKAPASAHRHEGEGDHLQIHQWVCISTCHGLEEGWWPEDL